MEFISGSFGKFLVYLARTSFGGVMCLFLSGVLTGLAAASLFKRPRGDDEKKGKPWRIIVTFGFALLFLVISLACGKADVVIGYWPMFVAGLVIGLFMRLFPVAGSSVTGVLALLVVILLLSLVWTFKAFTGKTAVLEVRITNVRQDGDVKVTMLNVKDLKKETEKDYKIRGNMWGISANVAVMKDWVVMLGGRTYYRLNSVVGLERIGRDRLVMKHQNFHPSSQPAWDELWTFGEKNEGKLPGVRAVYGEIVTKTPVEGRVYRFYVDNDGGIVPELIKDVK